MENNQNSDKRDWEESEYAQDSFDLFLLHKKLDKLFEDFCNEDYNYWEIYAQVYQAKDPSELDAKVKSRAEYIVKTLHGSLSQDSQFTLRTMREIAVVPLETNCKTIGDIVRFRLQWESPISGMDERIEKFEKSFDTLVGPYTVVRLQRSFKKPKVYFPFLDFYVLDDLYAIFAGDKAILVGWGTNE